MARFPSHLHFCIFSFFVILFAFQRSQVCWSPTIIARQKILCVCLWGQFFLLRLFTFHSVSSYFNCNSCELVLCPSLFLILFSTFLDSGFQSLSSFLVFFPCSLPLKVHFPSSSTSTVVSSFFPSFQYFSFNSCSLANQDFQKDHNLAFFLFFLFLSHFFRAFRLANFGFSP